MGGWKNGRMGRWMKQYTGRWVVGWMRLIPGWVARYTNMLVAVEMHLWTGAPKEAFSIILTLA